LGQSKAPKHIASPKADTMRSVTPVLQLPVQEPVKLTPDLTLQNSINILAYTTDQRAGPVSGHTLAPLVAMICDKD
jgi:hypothetical protein